MTIKKHHKIALLIVAAGAIGAMLLRNKPESEPVLAGGTVKKRSTPAKQVASPDAATIQAARKKYLSGTEARYDEYLETLEQYRSEYSAKLKAYYDGIARAITPATKWSLYDPVKGWGSAFGDYRGTSTYNLSEAVQNYATYLPGKYGTKPVYTPPVFKN